MKCPECDKTNFEMKSYPPQPIGENPDLPFDDSPEFICKECGYESKWNDAVINYYKKVIK